MKINIIAVGTMSKEFKILYQSYAKKISYYATVKLTEIRDIKDKNIEISKYKETKLLLESIPKNSKVFLCSLKGKQYTSEEFAEFFQEDNLTFIIGGSNGVIEEEFKNKIAFSKMTMPHKMFRVLLVEQIFRGFSILNNGKYHK